VTHEDRTAALLRSLDVFGQIVGSAMSGQDFVSFPDPTLIGEVSAGGICMWPETTRWTVQLFEAELARAWNNPVPRPTLQASAFGDVVPREQAGSPKKRTTTARPYATHACVLLAVEWLCGASSVGDAEAAALRDARDRLWALEQWLRNGKTAAPAGAQAELVIEATIAGTAGRTTTVTLPLGVSEQALARVLTGTVQAEGGAAWELAHTTGELSIRVGVRVPGPQEPVWPTTGAVAVTPRVIGFSSGLRLKVADQLTEGALCVVDFTPNTVLVKADGAIVPYQTWPKPISGALSLGEQGEVAWNNVMGKGPDGPTPHLMHRSTPDAEVTIVPLPFRPARGLWSQGRLYLTCLPTADAKGGIGSWAPGEEARLEWPDLTLQAILPLGDGLSLEPHALDAAERPLRQRATHGWTWTPGQSPTRRPLGPHGAVSAVASSAGWTARAYPHADVIMFEAPDGHVVSMRCYMPLRLAWVEDALVVFAGDRHVLFFEHVIPGLEGSR
jgi:hypothetical protein